MHHTGALIGKQDAGRAGKHTGAECKIERSVHTPHSITYNINTWHCARELSTLSREISRAEKVEDLTFFVFPANHVQWNRIANSKRVRN